MQFVDKDTELSFSELDSKDQITVLMGGIDDICSMQVMELTETEIRRLCTWLKEAVQQLDQTEEET